MIVDIFHGQQFRVSLDQFTDSIQRWEIVRKQLIVGDRVALTMRDTLNNEHTYVFPIASAAFDAYANAIAP